MYRVRTSIVTLRQELNAHVDENDSHRIYSCTATVFFFSHANIQPSSHEIGFRRFRRQNYNDIEMVFIVFFFYFFGQNSVLCFVRVLWYT